ncbi:MAG: IS110 family transposase [Pseudomonadota bacterium]
MQYAGLDVSVKETAICMVDAEGAPIWEGKVATDVGEIHEALRRHAPSLTKAGMETGLVAVWLWHGLRDAGVPLDCIHARRAAAALKLQTNKTDRNDARGLAQLVRSGWYAPVPMKSLETHRVRAVLVARDQLVRMCTALINKIRGLAKTFGILIGPGKGGSFDRAVQNVLPKDQMLRDLFLGLLETLGVLRARRRLLDRQLERIARADPTCRVLMTAPGVGALTATAFAGAVEDPSRFQRARDVGAYLGLTPKRRPSGEIDIGGRIFKRGDRLTRRRPFEAASVILHRTEAASRLRSRAQAIALRSGSWKARVALARKLATVLFRMMRDGATFEPAPQAG